MIDKSFFKQCKNKFCSHKLCLVWFLLLHFLLLGLSVVSSFSPGSAVSTFPHRPLLSSKSSCRPKLSWLLPFGQFRHPVQCGPRPQACRPTHQCSYQCNSLKCDQHVRNHNVTLANSPVQLSVQLSV